MVGDGGLRNATLVRIGHTKKSRPDWRILENDQKTQKEIRMPIYRSLAALALTPIVAGMPPRPAQRESAATVMSRLPLYFEPNQGQTDPEAEFLLRGQGYMLFLTGKETILRFVSRGEESPAIRVSLQGANGSARATGLDRLPGVSNYFLGNDPAKWRANVPHYAKVRYTAVYPGIDMVFYGQSRELEYDFVLAPGADPGVIRLAYAGVDGMRLDKNGDLVLRAAGAEVRQHRPMVYQEAGGERRIIDGQYELLAKNQVRLAVGAYDERLPLVIDPILSYATFLGGEDVDYGLAVAAGDDGSAYVTGYTQSLTFPRVAGLPGQTTLKGGQDAFVMRVNPTGTALVYSTYLGGNGTTVDLNPLAFTGEMGQAIAVDSAGNAYVAGQTDSTDFPIVNALQRTYGGGATDGFVAKLNPTGTALLYSTYFGGSDYDGFFGLALDSANNVYVTGLTYSALPYRVIGTRSPTGSQLGDVFVAKLPTGATLEYAVVVSGSDDDEPLGIAVDNLNRAYVAGLTFSTDFPVTANAFQQRSAGGSDAFVFRLNSTGTALEYASYLGGDGDDFALGVAVDPSYNTYVAGATYGDGPGVIPFPTANAFQSKYGGGIADGFVAKVNPSGSALVFSTYLGGSNGDYLRHVSVDQAGNIFVGGATSSLDFPTTPNATQKANRGGADAVVVKMDANGSYDLARNQPAPLLFATYFGGAGDDYVFGIATSKTGEVYLTGLFIGTPSSSYFPSTQTPPIYGTPGSSETGFVAKLANANLRMTLATPPRFPQAPSPQAGSNVSFTAQLINQAGSQEAVNAAVVGNLPSTATLVSCVAGSVSCGTPGGTTVNAVVNPQLPAGSAVDISMTVHINDNVPAGTVIPVRVRGRSDTNDPDESDNEMVVSFTTTGAGSICSYQLSRMSASVSPAGDLGRVDVITPPGCAWNASSNNVSAVTVSPANSSGNGPLRFTVMANTGSAVRSTNLTIAGETFSVIQAANGCTMTPGVGSPSVPAGGGSDTLTVSAGTGCSWTAAASSWITFPTGIAGIGSGSRVYNTSANTATSPRTGSITVGSQTVHLAQGGANPAQLFTDVPASNVFFNHITLMKLNNITSGCTPTAYCPDDTTTRGQMAVFIVRLLMGGDNFSFQQAPFFTDVPTGHVFFKWIQKMKELGITSGCSPTTYCPNDPVTRGQMAVFIIRAMLGITATDTFPFSATPRFTDVASGYPFFSFIQKMAERGITTGCSPTTYCPDAPTTRGQMAVFLIRALATQ
jgi:S-layer homology domain/Domain of unknown function DUF11/Beta-propeller repeat